MRPRSFQRVIGAPVTIRPLLGPELSTFFARPADGSGVALLESRLVECAHLPGHLLAGFGLVDLDCWVGGNVRRFRGRLGMSLARVVPSLSDYRNFNVSYLQNLQRYINELNILLSCLDTLSRNPKDDILQARIAVKIIVSECRQCHVL